LLEEKRHHTGTSHSRICIDMISIARRKLLMLSGVPVLCRLQVERTNYNGLGLSTAIGAGIAATPTDLADGVKCLGTGCGDRRSSEGKALRLIEHDLLRGLPNRAPNAFADT
jgi:hypothetical protein